MKRLVLSIVFLFSALYSFGQDDETKTLINGYEMVIEILADRYGLDTIYVDPDIRDKYFLNEIPNGKLVVLSKLNHYAFKGVIPTETVIFSIEYFKHSKRRYQITVYPEVFTGEYINDGASITPELTNDLNTFDLADDILIFKLIQPEGKTDWELWDSYELNRLK